MRNRLMMLYTSAFKGITSKAISHRVNQAIMN